MTGDPTVLVVGGGVTGVGVARDLALRGIETTLLERGGLGSGTSGRSHGLLHSGARYADSDPDAAAACHEERQIHEDIAGSCLRATGGLFVQVEGDDPAYFEQKRQACASAGIETEVLGRAAARERVPGLAAETVRALAVPDAVIWPSRLVAAVAADAVAHGATIHTDAPLEGFSVADDRIVAARVGGGVDRRVQPDYLVNAAGPWAGTVARMAGAQVGLAPTRGVMVAVDHDSPAPVLNRCREPADGDIVVPHGTQSVLGTTSVPVEDPSSYPTPDWEVKRCIEECAAMLPGVENAAVNRTWWGVRPLYAPDEAGTDRRGVSRDSVVLDHAAEAVENLYSVVGGKLTTYRRMAAAVVDRLCARLGVDRACETATRRLPAADNPARLDDLVAAYGGPNPTDTDIVTADPT